jgi:predicted dehydrogenase
MNILIVGCGGHARSWLGYIQKNPNCKVVGIVDTDTEKLTHADLWGVSEEYAYPSIAEAVRFTDEPIDVALITSPIPTHHLLATQAIEQGLHVILEKNMASTIEQAQALLKLARSHPELCTSMGTQYRFRPNWWTLHELFNPRSPKDVNPIGNISMVRAKVAAKQGDMRYGWRSWLPDIFAEDMMAHHIDCLRYVLGMEVIKVQSQVFKPHWSQWLGSSTTFSNLVFAPLGKENHKEEWVYAQYYGDWQSRGNRREWEMDFEFQGKHGAVRIEYPVDEKSIDQPSPSWDGLWEKSPLGSLVGEPFGSRIVAYIDSPDLRTQTIKEIPKRTDIENTKKNYSDQMYILEELYDCIKSGTKDAKKSKQPMINFEQGYKTFLVTRCAIESSKTGNTIWVPKYWLEQVTEM